MFTAGIATHLLALLLRIVLGAVALTIACLWKPQRGKVLFCVFIGIALVAEPLVELTAYVVALMPAYVGAYGGWNGGRQNGAQFYVWLYQAFSLIKLLLCCVSTILLVVYAVSRREAVDIDASAKAESEMLASPVPARRWDTHLRPNQLIEIARRREWGHAIDCVPAVLFFCFFMYAFGSVLFDNSYQARDLRNLGWMLSLVASLGFLVYLLMKDCFGGVSIGKWFTQCRVVDASSGIPASVPQTMLRNAIFVLFPIGSMVELAVANFRPDRKRLGDLWAGTMVVHGPADIVDGERVEPTVAEAEAVAALKKHPLDD